MSELLPAPARSLAPVRHVAILAVVALASCVGGVLGTLLTSSREAQAQAFSSTIQVPRGGLTFRAADGRAIARLSYDDRGGKFEILDERGALVPSIALEPRVVHPGAGSLIGPQTIWSVDETPDPWARDPVSTTKPPSGL